MRPAVDASVAIEWSVEEDGSDAADRLLNDSKELYAPRPMASEVANALWRKARLGEIEQDKADTPITCLSETPVRRGADETVCADAVRPAVALDRPVYDCMYPALAHRLDARLVAADARFATAPVSTMHGKQVGGTFRLTAPSHRRERLAPIGGGTTGELCISAALPVDKSQNMVKFFPPLTISMI